MSSTVSVPFTSGSSLQQKKVLQMAAGHRVSVPFTSGSSLQHAFLSSSSCLSLSVSVPFTSGSSLQHDGYQERRRFEVLSFSSLYIGILAATERVGLKFEQMYKFQFPLHRDPRCNSLAFQTMLACGLRFSSLYIGILAATNCKAGIICQDCRFQFPLHRDPRCNLTASSV